MKIKNWTLASRIERNGRKRSVRRPKLTAIKESSAPGRRRRSASGWSLKEILKENGGSSCHHHLT